MAINRAEHPITSEEAVRVLRNLADNIAEDARTSMRFGDTRPEVLRWAADRLEGDTT